MYSQNRFSELKVSKEEEEECGNNISTNHFCAPNIWLLVCEFLFPLNELKGPKRAAAYAISQVSIL